MTEISHHRLTHIPEIFHSVETGLPFSRCYDCGGSLATHEHGYLIQKVVNGTETLLELAICAGCHDRLQQSYSKESRERIWNFYLDHADLPGRVKKFSAMPPAPDYWLNSCLTCKTLKGRLQEYVIAARCMDHYLVLDETPMLVCADCMEKIMDLMSEESLGTYDRWMDRALPPYTGLAKEKPRRRVFL
jgi:hypothetical protein